MIQAFEDSATTILIFFDETFFIWAHDMSCNIRKSVHNAIVRQTTNTSSWETDRANIKIKINNQGSSIWIYTHWHGSELPHLLQDALAKARPRWNDASYATRILVDQITKDGRDQETGWGLSLEIQDNERNILEVDLMHQQVLVLAESGETLRKCCFDEYIAMQDAATWRNKR